jgi:hypothetical protein
MTYTHIYFLFFLILCSSIDGLYVSSGPSSYAPDVLDIGPQVFFLRRIRKGGTRQDGRLEGAYVSYDYLKKQSFYFGGTWETLTGNIEGETGRGASLKSTIKDQLFEGRIGYTFQHPSVLHTFFVPLIGYGYFVENNSYNPPSPMTFTYVNSYQYALTGFLTGADLNTYFGFWISLKVRFMIDGTAKVEDDPYSEEDVELKMNDELSFRLDTPLIFSPPFFGSHLKITLTPCYEYRHYGGRKGYPYNYIDTEMNLIGGRVSAMLRF